MTANRRNDRNNPYLIEGMAVKFHRSAAGVLWRWRTELAIVLAAVAGDTGLEVAVLKDEEEENHG
jgi:hypothetical protein